MTCKKKNCNCGGGCKGSCEPPKKTFLTEVRRVSSIEQGEPPKWDTPFYDEMPEGRHIVIPEEGGLFHLGCSLPERWAIGQWLYIEQVGAYEVVGHNDRDLVLRNRPGIASNPAPGSNYVGSRRYWPIDPNSVSTNYLVNQLNDAIQEEEFKFCPRTPEATQNFTGNPVAARVSTVECEPCGGGSQSLTRCLYTWKNIIFKWITIALPLMQKISRSTKTFTRAGVEVTEPVLPVVVDPETGDLQKLELPSQNSIQIFYGGASYFTQVPSDFASSYYTLSPDPATGRPAFTKLIPDKPADYAAEVYFLTIDQASGELAWAKFSDHDS